MRLFFGFVFCIISLVGSTQHIIPLKNKNGVKYIDCIVDGVPIEFVFDTGATSTILSLDAFNALTLKSGSYKLLRIESFQVADGNTVTANTYLADSLCINELCFEDIEFSVFEAMNSPCLLGQNVFAKLYSYEIQSNQIKLTARNYTGDDYFQSYSKETLIDLSIQMFQSLFDITFQSLTTLEYKVSDAKYILDKYDSTLIFRFDAFSNKTFRDVYSRVKYHDFCEKYTKDLVGRVMFDLISDKEFLEIMIKEMIALKIEEFQFNICIPFQDKEYCFKRVVYTDQFNEKKSFYSQNDIKVY